MIAYVIAACGIKKLISLCKPIGRLLCTMESATRRKAIDEIKQIQIVGRDFLPEDYSRLLNLDEDERRPDRDLEQIYELMRRMETINSDEKCSLCCDSVITHQLPCHPDHKSCAECIRIRCHSMGAFFNPTHSVFDPLTSCYVDNRQTVGRLYVDSR